MVTTIWQFPSQTKDNRLCIYACDFFSVTPEMIGEVDAVYDRGALEAVNVGDRQGYVKLMGRLVGKSFRWDFKQVLWTELKLLFFLDTCWMPMSTMTRSSRDHRGIFQEMKFSTCLVSCSYLHDDLTSTFPSYNVSCFPQKTKSWRFWRRPILATTVGKSITWVSQCWKSFMKLNHQKCNPNKSTYF